MYRLQNYLAMLNDRRRTAAFEQAVRAVVRPDDVVLDLGAGTGLLSFMALAAGARHVYAVEQLPIVELALRIARASGLADRITFIQADARELNLPERVSCIVADIRGILPVLGDNLDVFEEVRRRWLAPEGRTVPLEDEIFVAPVSNRTAHRLVADWRQVANGLTYEAAFDVAANTCHDAPTDPADVLAPGQSIGSVFYGRDNDRTIGRRVRFVVEREGAMTGIATWFVSTLAPGVVFETSPFSPRSVYSQGFFPLSEARSVVPGDEIEIEIAAHRIPSDSIWTWRVEQRGRVAWTETHSTFAGTLYGLRGRALLDGSRRPSLSKDGALARELLGAVDGQISVKELAGRVAAAHPERFPSPDDALTYVVKIVGRFSA